ncbi:MAG TPA: polyprenyl synthetase family protein [Rhabdaerophilum sp.]|nr:polyprenyl synthetase family protein [Rhabdaerophilum sp.]
MTEPKLTIAMDETARAVDAFLEARLAEGHRPARLVAALRHALFAGGKRMRPFLVVEAARLFGVEGVGPLHVAAALEAVHCYSLIHDDLPAMDNDDMRRGQPTVHRAFDEATAVLAGDSLLTLAFTILARKEAGISAGRRLRLIGQLADAAGIDGMIGGQMLDLAAEGRFDAHPPRQSIATIRRLQSLKTGALIVFALRSAASLAPGATPVEKKALATYGRELGLAFQIRDDLLDAEGHSGTVGKAVGKDAAAGKATFLAHLGIEGARRELDRATVAGEAALSGAFGDRASVLSALLRYNRSRDR